MAPVSVCVRPTKSNSSEGEKYETKVAVVVFYFFFVLQKRKRVPIPLLGRQNWVTKAGRRHNLVPGGHSLRPAGAGVLFQLQDYKVYIKIVPYKIEKKILFIVY